MHSYEGALGPRPVSAPGISAERELALVSGANRLGYGYYSVRGGRLEARLAIEDAGSGKMEMELSASAAADGVIPAASELARQIQSAARPLRPASASGLKAYVEALEGNDATAAARNLEQALAASPDYAPAYRLLGQLKTRAQDRAGASAVLARGLSHDLRPLDRAGLELDAAEIRGDRRARLQALDAIAKLNPSDPVAWRALADDAMSAHRYAQAAAGFGKALEIEPEDVNTLNQLGYARGYAGDFAAAMDALRRYQALRPAEANPLDSMGDVNLLTGRLHEAEAFYLQSSRKSPHFQMDGSLFKAAMARLMAGDIAGADGLARRYLDARAADKDPALDSRKAEWAWISGRRKEARAQLEAFARSAEQGPTREPASRAYAELAVWNMLLGDAGAAARMAQEATTTADASGATVAAVARLIASPPASLEEWTARAGGEFPGTAANPVRDLTAAYALLLAREFEPASRILQRLYDEGAPAGGEGLPVLLAWTYLETGRDKEAAALLGLNPIPAETGAGPFVSFYFPRLYDLRARVAAREGKGNEAAADRKLFEALSGPDALVWDGERRAAQTP